MRPAHASQTRKSPEKAEVKVAVAPQGCPNSSERTQVCPSPSNRVFGFGHRWGVPLHPNRKSPSASPLVVLCRLQKLPTSMQAVVVLH